MSDKMIENNQVSIVGEVMSPFTFSHEVFGEGFYMADIAVRRLSDSEDLIPVMVSERLVDVTENLAGAMVRVAGQFRSYNRHEEKKNKLVFENILSIIYILHGYVVNFHMLSDFVYFYLLLP